MIKVLETEDTTLLSIYKERLVESEELASVIEKSFKSNVKIWEGKPDSLALIPRKRSKVVDNRIFMATESQLNKLTARPVKPMIIPANETPEAQQIASDLQDYFLDLYRKRKVKKIFKRGLRSLHFARLFCVKPFWNSDIDDVDVAYVDPRKVRVAKTATCEEESDFVIEKIDTKKLLDMLYAFPESKEKILQLSGLTEEQAMVKNPRQEYEEVWIGDGAMWIYKNAVIKKQKNPYYDFDGLMLAPEEMAELEQREPGSNTHSMNGRRRRPVLGKFKGEQDARKGAVKANPEEANKYESYLYNYFDKPRKPYIFGTVLEVEDSPVGRTTLIEVTSDLQEGVSKRKRQIADNSDFVNGITKVDTDKTTMTLAQARAAHYDPEGIVYGAGVAAGVTRETGQSLPTMVFEDMQDSRNELDEIFGTGATFRGSQGSKDETATGRAILREEGLSRLDEFVTLIDYAGQELYSWWFQLMKVRYTETHLVKGIGLAKAQRVIEIMQDDLQDGIEIQIMPGQTLPDDTLYRAERAAEDMKAGVIDPITYLEKSGGYDNPQEVVKKAVMFKASPFSILEMTDKDMEQLAKGLQILQMVTVASQPPQPAVPGDGGAEVPDDRAAKVAEFAKRIEQVVNSPEFQALPPEEQKAKVGEMRSALASLQGGK